MKYINEQTKGTNKIIRILNKKAQRLRIKYCNECHKEESTMYRIQYKLPKEWVFVCKSCLLKLKPNNKAYTYGGTWKK